MDFKDATSLEMAVLLLFICLFYVVLFFSLEYLKLRERTGHQYIKDHDKAKKDKWEAWRKHGSRT